MPNRLIISAVTLAAALIFGFVVVWPKYQDFQRTNLEIEQKKAELDSKTVYYSKIKEVWEKLETYEESLVKVDSAVPDGYSIPVLFNYLQKTAGETGLVISGLTFDGVSGDNPKEIGFSVAVSGSYSSFKDFLAALEASERFFKIKSFQLSSSDQDEGFSFNLGISTYSY